MEKIINQIDWNAAIGITLWIMCSLAVLFIPHLTQHYYNKGFKAGVKSTYRYLVEFPDGSRDWILSPPDEDDQYMTLIKKK